MRLSLSTNMDEVFAQMDRFVEQAQTVAVPRALNRLRDQAQTVGLRRVSEIYRVGPRTMDRYLTVHMASARNLEASITVRGMGFPLYTFNPRPTKDGVSVSIKGRRVVVPHAFLASMESGHRGVFSRGAYGGKSSKSQFVPTGKKFGKFLLGRKRLPINELFTFGPTEAFRSDEVVEAMQARMHEQAARVLEREMRFASRGS